MRKFAKRSSCLLLTLVMLLGMLPTTALAAHDGSGKPLDVKGQLYVAIYKGDGFPGEPAVYEGTDNYAFVVKDRRGEFKIGYGTFASNASTVLKTDILNNLIQGAGSSDEQVWGYYSANGTNDMILEGSGLLDPANQQTIIQNVKRISAQEAANYKIIWYVIKYQTRSQWHIDGVIVRKDQYSVNYYGNGNTGGNAPHGVSNLTEAEISTYKIRDNTGNLVREGYEFVGWNTKDDYTGTFYKPDTAVKLDDFNETNNTLSLYAQWQKKEVGYTATVKTYLDGSLCDASEIHGNDAPTLYLSKDNGNTLIPLTRKDTGTYTAAGVANDTYELYRKDSGSAPETHKVGNYTLSIHGSNATLYVSHYSVAYDLNGGEVNESKESELAPTNYLEGTLVSVAGVTPTRKGYTFLGWQDEDGKVYQPGAELTGKISKQHRLTAQWEKTVNVTINVTINHAGGDGYDQMETKDDVQLALVRRANGSSAYLETGDVLTLNKTSHDGFKCEEGANKTTYTATEPTFTNMPGGTAEYRVVTSKSGYDTTITPAKDANGNWIINVVMTYNPTNFDLDFTVEVDESVPEQYIPDAVIAKVTFWASDRNRWEIITQHEDGNPGVRVDIDPRTRSGTGSYPVWKYESNGTNPYGYRIQVTAFVYPDGTIVPASQVLQDVEWSDHVYTAAMDDVTDGRTYGALGGAYFDDGDSGQKGALKATLTMPLYNVTFKANGGEIHEKDDLVLPEQYRVPDLDSYVPVREGGYVFGGWYLDANGNGKLDAEETAAVNSGDDLTADITLIAKWKTPLTIRGTVTIDGSYRQGEDYVDINDVDRPKTVQVRLWKVGQAGAVEVSNRTFGEYSETDAIDEATVDYSFTGIPNDGTQYRIVVDIQNYETTYAHEPTVQSFSANDYTAVFGDNNTAEVNAHLAFKPESYVQKVQVDATAIGEGFRPSSVLAEILYREVGSTGSFTRISQHNAEPCGIEIELPNGMGEGEERVWKALYNATPYEYAANISVVDGTAYVGANVPYHVTYSGTTVWDNTTNQLTGGVVNEFGVPTGVLKATLVPNEYIVTFDLDIADRIGGMDAYLQSDGTFSTTHKWSFDTAISAVPTRSGYVFTGWSCNTTDAYDGTKIPAAIAEDITLTAQWEEDSNGDGVPDENQAIVTFVVEDGAWNDGTTAVKQVFVTKGSVLSAADVPSVGSKPNTGYKAGGWKEAITPNTENQITESVTYTYSYALRNDLSYTVKHVVKGSGKILRETPVVNQAYNTSVTANAATFEGYTLEGANTQTVTLTQDSTDIVFYYTPNNVTVTFEHQDGEGKKLRDDTTAVAVVDSEITRADYQATITGYTYVEGTDETYTVRAENNVVALVYEPNVYDYTVEYYFEGNPNLDSTVSGTANYKSVINATDHELNQVPTGYTLDTVTGAPLTVGADESQNVIRFYYAADENENRTPDKYEVTVTYRVVDGTWDGTDDKDKQVLFVLAEKKSANGVGVWVPTSRTLGDSIPTGMKPDTYHEQDIGRWDTAISEDTAVLKNITYTYTFSLNKYVISAEITNGTVTVNGESYTSGAVEHSDSETTIMVVTPADGYAVDSVKVDGAIWSTDKILNWSDKTWEFNHTGNHSLVVVCAPDANRNGTPNKYEMTVTYRVVHGTWSDGTATDKPETVVLKDSSGNWSESGSADLYAPTGMQPNTGYAAEGSGWDITPAKVWKDSPEAYTYIFPKAKHTLTVSVEGGTASMEGGTVEQSTTMEYDETPVKITFTPFANYVLDSESINDPESSAVLEKQGDGTYTYEYAYTRDAQIIVTFKEDLDNSGVPDVYERKVIFKIENGLWGAGGNGDDKVITAVLKTDGNNAENGTAEVEVPAGMTANSGYNQASGKWSATLGTAISLDKNSPAEQIYTYGFDPSVVENKWISYRVEHYLEDAAGSYQVDNASVETKVLYYTVVDGVVDATSYTVSGEKVGNELSAAAKTFTHHAYDSGNSGNVAKLTVTVSEDKKDTVSLDHDSTIKLFYTAKRYNVTYDFNGGSGANGVDYSDQTDLRYGTQLYIKAAPLRSGYTFVGWALDLNGNSTLDADEMVSANIHPAGASRALTGNRHMIAYWQPRTDLSYTVHYLEKGPNTQLAESVAVSGQTFGEEILRTDLDALVKTFEHFTLDSVSSTDSVIVGLGDNIFYLYYTRNSYDYTVEYYYGDVKDDTATVSGNASYGSAVSAYTPKLKPGYELERVEPISAITDDSMKNVMRVYYQPTHTATVTFRVVNGTWYEGDAADRTVAIVLVDGKGTLDRASVPVGMQANPGFKGGKWDSEPTVVADGITGDVTYTYTFVRSMTPVTPSATGSVTLTKVDSADPDTALANVLFNLCKADGTQLGSYKTGTDGTVTVKNLPVGEYYWIEVRPAEGYVLDPSKHTFKVFAGKTAEISISNTRTPIPEFFSGDHYGYVIGFSDGLVHPEANITRAQVATIFFRLLDEETRTENMRKSNDFLDVSEDMWCNTAISTLNAMGIISGYADGNFYPNASITRAQFAAIAARFDAAGNTTGATFRDIYGHWAQREIKVAYNNGWILGYSDGTFRPNQKITRAEAVTLINRVLQRVPEHKDDLLDNMVQWPDNMDPAEWYYLAIQEATNSHDYDRKRNGYERWTELREVRDWSELER